MILKHVLPAILLSSSSGIIAYFAFAFNAKRQFDPNDLNKSHRNLKVNNLLVFVILLVGSVAFVLFFVYIEWVGPKILKLTDDELFYLAIFWLVGPIVAVSIGCHAGIAPYWGKLFDRNTSNIQMFARRMVLFLIMAAAAIIGYVFLSRIGSLSLAQFIVGLGVVFLAPILSSAIGPRIMDWWSLRRRPIEETDYMIESTSKISDFTVTVEQSFLSDGSNAHAEGFGGVGPSIVLGENVFESLSDRARKATVYHEIGHHEHNDQLKQSLLTGTLFVVAAIVGTVTLNFLTPIFSGQEDGWKILAGVVVSVFIVILIWNVISGHISRKAEYAADEYAAEKVSAEAMIEALDDEVEDEWGILSRLLSTHPSNDERAENLGIER